MVNYVDNRQCRRHVVRGLLGAAAICTPAAAWAQAGVEDIVVTAQKREQNLQVVPISITALSADALVGNRVQDVRDLSAVAPNLTVRPAAGGQALPNFILRGIFTNGAAAGTDKGVSLYIDGVYLQAAQGAIFELADIERIEVLKGPQGTLFGRNSTGGAISIITRDPSGEFGVKQDLTYGNYDQFRTRTRVDLPRLGPISASLSYLHSQRHGDTRNLGAGTAWDYGPITDGRMGIRHSPKRFGDENIDAFAATVKVDLDPVKITYKFNYSDSNFTPEAEGISYITGATMLGFYNSIPAELRTPIDNKRPKAVNNWFSQQSHARAQGHNLTATWRVNDEISIKNILAYRKTSARAHFQLDGLGGLALGGVPFAVLVSNSYGLEKQWSNETQLNIDTDWFNFTAGYLHFSDRVASGGARNQYNVAAFMPLVGQNTPLVGTPFVVPANPGYESARVKMRSDAVYAQPELHLTDKLDLVGGIRITKDHKAGAEYLPIPSALPPGVSPRVPIHYRSSHVSVLAGVNYQVTPSTLLYAKYATGYISGGQLATLAFRPETAKSWEGGVKTELFDRRWRSNLSVFHVKYGSIQYVTAGALTGNPATALFGQAVVSSADAKADGFEWENTIVPVEGLTLTANLGYTDFKFDQSTVAPGFAFVSGAPGYQEFARPKWTANLAAQYETAEVVAGGRLIARVDANFRSKALMTSDITVGDGPASPADPGIIDAATVKAYWIVNGRLGLAGVNVGGVKANIGLWGRNIFNNRSMVQYVGLGLGAAGYIAPALYERARTYGLDVGFEF